MTNHTLLSSSLSGEVVQLCRELLDRAQAGDITGLGVVVILPRGRYVVDCCGSAKRDPTFTRGALASLDDCLREMVHRRRDANTTLM
ncbi:hypothetical protein [Methylibium sp.]|uniref:hypothetical protein n=1 Tax=Methylibium sp. TaxID=2067992 RepID=UPI001840108A|nr:hypothetical protein [Methylibium sp.]MBA3590363.1 hypothetical protein [Methylibium sp.]